MKESLYISGYGLVNALGSDNNTIKEQLFLASQHGLSRRSDLLLEGDITVADVNVVLPSLADKPKHLRSRNNQLALLAIEQIRSQANNLIAQVGKNRIAIVVGTSTSGISEGEAAMKVLQAEGQFPEHYDYQQQEIFNTSEFVAQELGVTGVCLTISTACSSSAKAFKTAAEMIDSGLADAAIVGGVDSICGMTINGFHALSSTSAGVCQPSSANRDGINIGEAAALAILTKQAARVKLLGVGESSDAHHMSAPHPEGIGAIEAMQGALNEANFAASDVDYVNLHGTATPKNDAMEAIAVQQVFGSDTPCSSSKGLIGHTLGAAGATEVGLCWLMLGGDDQQDNHNYAPHVWDEVIDEDLPELMLTKQGQQKSTAIRSCLSNSFAFGGNNVSVLIGLS